MGQIKNIKLHIVTDIKMVYISSSGTVNESKSPWRLSIFSDMFWGLVNFVALFFQTMFSPHLTKHGNTHSSDYKPDGGGGGPRRRMGRLNQGGGGPASPGNLPPGGG